MSALGFARIPVGQVTLHAAIQGKGPPVILLHGWPEFWLSWRHILPAVAAAGFTAVAPDLRGFNLSDAPADVAAYALDRLADDVTGLLDALGEPHAILVGHDWGASVAWHTALTAPARVSAVAALNLGHRARGMFPPTREFARLPDGRFNYVLEMLALPDVEARYLADLPAVLTHFMKGAAWDASFWPDVRDAYVDNFRHAGMRSVNLYRNLDANWLRAKALRTQVVSQPALMLLAQNDPVLPPSSAHGLQEVVPRVEVHTLERCGHWMAQERPHEVNRLLIPWLVAQRPRRGT